MCILSKTHAHGYTRARTHTRTHTKMKKGQGHELILPLFLFFLSLLGGGVFTVTYIMQLVFGKLLLLFQLGQVLVEAPDSYFFQGIINLQTATFGSQVFFIYKVVNGIF